MASKQPERGDVNHRTGVTIARPLRPGRALPPHLEARKRDAVARIEAAKRQADRAS